MCGGTFLKGKIGHLTGKVDSRPELSAAALGRVREMDWVTFGGVLIRREAIDACGPFDKRYQWAYVLDVDYCFEARLRGFKAYQVPASLMHEENGTTGEMVAQNPTLKAKIDNNFQLFENKWRSFDKLFGTVRC